MDVIVTVGYIITIVISSLVETLGLLPIFDVKLSQSTTFFDSQALRLPWWDKSVVPSRHSYEHSFSLFHR